ncbi:MAG: hypothetical protein M1826_005060 [Phylliscum demangeonii]|nr:MAG: hypothetical protein M1826_005060 [Phylliscum demangeonii]
MKFVHYLFPVGAFIIGSVSLCITPSPVESESRELARRSTSLSSIRGSSKTCSRPLHIAELRTQKQAILAKRTTDEESPKNDKQEALARKGPIIYTSKQLADFREEYNAAQRASDTFRKNVQKAKDAGRKVAQADLDELSRLSAVTLQRRLVLIRARQGKPLDRRTSVTRQEVASLVQDPEIQQAAKSGIYDVQQLAEYKRNYLDALTRYRSKQKKMAKIAKEREISEAEKAALADIQRDYKLQRKIWDRVRKGYPVEGEVDHPKKSIDVLIKSPMLLEAAQSSGYSVEELAEARRSYLDAYNAARTLRNELSRVQEITDEQKTRLQTLFEAVNYQKRRFERMSKGRSADGDAALPHHDLTFLRKDAEIQRIAQLGGYSVEEVAVQKRAYLDAMYPYRDATLYITAVKKNGGTLTVEEEERFVKIDHVFQLQKTGWNRMKKGHRADPASSPAPKLGRLAADVATLRGKAGDDEIAYYYSSQQIAMYDQRFLDALDNLHDFKAQISIAEQSGRPITKAEDDELNRLLEIYVQQRTEWLRVRQGLYVDSLGNVGKAVTYTAKEIQDYSQQHLDALRILRSAERQLAAAAEAGHPPTPDDEARIRALRDDFNLKKTTWRRARKGNPVERVLYTPRARSVAQSTSSPETQPGSQAPPNKAKADAETDAQAVPETNPSTNQPLQMAGHHLLAPFLSSASHFLQRLGRQWRAMPWTRYLAKPRLNMVKPAELLRAEPALL